MTFSNFWARAAQHPEQVAVVEADERRISAGELLASVNQLTHGLRALGLQRGDVIAAVLPNSLQAYELYLAMQQMGCYLVPINFHLVGPEIAYILQDCEAKAFIINERFADAWPSCRSRARLPRNARLLRRLGGWLSRPTRS